MKGFPMQVNMAPTIASNKGVKSRCPKQKPIEEMEHMAAYQDRSTAEKKATWSKTQMLGLAGVFEAAVAGANREVNMLFSQYAAVLSERAALDASQVRDLEGILNEARQLEAQLQEKKDNLKHTLVLIADKLKG
ncbi:unnamed protein product [Boreogadus saida]|uniref:testis-expressed protein 12-like n=1 Tax=Gadus chalcogrammus TaxID=1042646 RepID=UPI0024C49D19|nr:testis-expressed protein 12-like [Gadus chalcogrammus]XP_056467739.1 testis-expressed protein 12-like [Gadus chalcogrammus]